MSEVEARCYFCGGSGATATAGIGDTVGVAVHIDCWMEEVR